MKRENNLAAEDMLMPNAGDGDFDNFSKWKEFKNQEQGGGASKRRGSKGSIGEGTIAKQKLKKAAKTVAIVTSLGNTKSKQERALTGVVKGAKRGERKSFDSAKPKDVRVSHGVSRARKNSK